MVEAPPHSAAPLCDKQASQRPGEGIRLDCRWRIRGWGGFPAHDEKMHHSALTRCINSGAPRTAFTAPWKLSENFHD
ncbi:MAG: hypothetical protein RLZZ436_489 [Planctomycetota bacterium]